MKYVTGAPTGHTLIYVTGALTGHTLGRSVVVTVHHLREASGKRPKDRQAAKIRALGEALAAAGFLALDKRAKVLGLCRSTAWSVLQGHHKASGLSATTINRMLAAPSLPPSVRAILLEYIEEKTAGVYGDCKKRRRQFATRLAQVVPEIVAPSIQPKIGSCWRMRAPSRSVERQVSIPQGRASQPAQHQLIKYLLQVLQTFRCSTLEACEFRDKFNMEH